MLVLSRKHGEKIRIGNDIEVVILKVNRHSVSLGFECPRNVPVHRKEVHERIKAERAREAQASRVA